jgi:hypothetical protein
VRHAINLFRGPDLRDHLESLREAAIAGVDNASDDHLLTVDATTWLANLLEEFTLDEITLRPDDGIWEASDKLRRDRQGVYGFATFTLPFDGDPGLFRFQPNLYGPAYPQAAIDGGAGVLTFEADFPTSTPPDFHSVSAQLVSRITTFLNVANAEAKTHRATLERELAGRIAAERNRVIEARAALRELSIPVRERADAPKTYAMPGIRRRPAPVLPSPTGSGQPAALEPALVADFYEHVIDVMRSTGKAMERLHGTFASGSEPQKRDVLLVMLNSHYQGAAAGEVFNGVGKADIVLRFADHNVLVAECKIWSGIKSFRDALAQLEGYLTLRDTQAALIFFVRGLNAVKPVQEADSCLAGLAGASKLPYLGEDTEFRYRLTSTRTAERAIVLHTLFFHVPKLS